MSEIRIEELTEKTNIDDSNLIIVEDNDDTKKSTVLELKRAIIGDSADPSQYKVYSSEYIHEIINSILASINYKPTRSEFDALKKQVDTLLDNSGCWSGCSSGCSSGSTGFTKDPELITARGSYDTLGNRLDGDIKSAENKFIQFPINEHTGFDISLVDYKRGIMSVEVPSYSKDSIISIKGLNRYDGSVYGAAKTYAEVSSIEDNTGLRFNISKSRYIFTIPFGTTLSAGAYHMYSLNEIPEAYKDKNITFTIVFSDGTVTSVPFSFASHISFTIFKSATAFQLNIDNSYISNNDVVIMRNIMISRVSSSEYHKFSDETISVPANTVKQLNYSNLDAIESISRSAGLLKVSVLDTSFDGDEIRSKINSLEGALLDTVDKCGLIEDYGKYVYADKITEADNDLCVITDDHNMRRNGHDSIKVQLMEHSSTDKPRFTIPLSDLLNIKDAGTISIQLYIDVTLYEYFSDSDGIQIMFSSDDIRSNPTINYFYINIGKNKFNQGWNTIKFKTSQLTVHGNPDKTKITMVNFAVFTSDFTSYKTFWINSIILGQRMTPTVLFAFDDTYEGAFDYQYPLLYTNNIPATVFFNDKRTMTRDEMEKYCTLVFNQGWEIGNYGCNPNKENMTRDDNGRVQYLGLQNNLTYLRANFCNNITSYAAPYGNLRPITVNILKSLGFNIAKAASNSYCSFFSDKDMVIPMHLLSNKTTSESMINKIKECIETGQTICIYTGNVTQYGDEISAKKEMFEAVVKFIKSQVDLGKLQCLTFNEFYNKCVR